MHSDACVDLDCVMVWNIDLSVFDFFRPSVFFPTVWSVIANGGWIIFLYFGLRGFKEYWLEHIQHLFEHHRHFVLLALNIPRMNEQTPKAVEQIFAQLHGSLSKPNLIEKYWKGQTQERFSFEIVSMGGYIQFYVRTNAAYRDLVESAFFSQYPDAEIVEVPDYIDKFPQRLPDPEWRVWGAEIGLTKPDVYPIRTYPNFEHNLSKDFFKDPLGGLMESLSKIGPDENIMIQYVATPVGDHWKEHAKHIIDELIGAQAHQTDPLWAQIIRFPVEAVEKIISFMIPAGEDHGRVHAAGGQEPPNKVQYMTTGEKLVVEGIQAKIAKIGYEVKIRALYIGRHASFSKPRGVVPIKGALRQFSTQDMNALSPIGSTVSDVDYLTFLNPRRQTKILKAYRTRHPEMGAGEGKIFNIEELATIFHFPSVSVKAPLMKKTEYKTAEPPFALPISEGYTMRRAPPAPAEGHGHGASPGHAPPENLPIH